MKKGKKGKKKQKKNNFSNIRRNRLTIFTVLLCFAFGLLAISLIKTIFLDGKVYQAKLLSLTDKIVEGPSAPRGRIYDRNYNLLVDNQLVPTIYYEKDKSRSTKDEIELAYYASQHISLDLSKLTIQMTKDFYLLLYPEIGESKITEEERQLLEYRKITSSMIYQYKIDRITEEDLAVLQEEDRKAAYLYSLMNTGYSYEGKIIKSKDVTESEVAFIAEHQEEMPGFSVRSNWDRVYLYGDTFRSILGTVSSIEQGLPYESKEEYLQKGYALTDRVGLSYLEKQYESILKGQKEKYRVVSNHKTELIQEAVRGNDIVLTIDITLQQEVDRILSEELLKAKKEPNTDLFNRSFVVIQQPYTGEILAMSGKQVILENGTYVVTDYTPGVVTSPMTPGSVVKGASMLVGYNTGAVKIGQYQLDECVKIAGTPKKCSHETLGMINDITALAQSSNVYQFKIAMKVGGANYVYGAPLQINPDAFEIYRTTLREFGLGIKTGIDLPVESVGYIGTKTDPGLLLDLAMGQYDTYTPIQLSQYINTFASNGSRYQPHLLKEVYKSSNTAELGELDYRVEPVLQNKVNTRQEYLDRIQLGFREVLISGTGRGIVNLDFRPAGKTGTSESFLDTDGDGIIDTESVSNAFVGYMPYEEPVMSIAVTSPDVENPNTRYSYHSYVNRRIAKNVINKYFELYPME